MKPFGCPRCSNIVHFDNDRCVRCGTRLGYRPWSDDMAAIDDAGAIFGEEGRQAFFCDNAGHGVCNWLVEDGEAGTLCRACRHNLVIPDLSVHGNREHWAKIELSKRHVFYSLIRWALPIPARADGQARSLAFSFLADVPDLAGGTEHAVTGHDSGLITINIAEADDAERERTRVAMGEPYRTLIGHFRHEIGHFYWDLLVADGGRLDDFRAMFGDERSDYGNALSAHYQDGPPPDWHNNFISAYASSHPWEDFAETWAHYIHMTDGLETALAYGLSLAENPLAEGVSVDPARYDPYRARGAQELADKWVPASIAINSINRSMGQPDLYPFVLTPAVIGKLGFIHDLVHSSGRM